jgi:hypothetical protein
MATKEKWIQKAVKEENVGKLRSTLKAKKGKKIPEEKLDKALNSKNKLTRERAQFAKNVRGLKKKKK